MNKDSDKKLQSQSVITIGAIINAMVNGIVGYIAVYFFQPIWIKIVKWWKQES